MADCLEFSDTETKFDQLGSNLQVGLTWLSKRVLSRAGSVLPPYGQSSGDHS
jgi:hypothetical protein